LSRLISPYYPAFDPIAKLAFNQAACPLGFGQDIPKLAPVHSALQRLILTTNITKSNIGIFWLRPHVSRLGSVLQKCPWPTDEAYLGMEPPRGDCLAFTDSYRPSQHFIIADMK
jgi:hypothetical protein